MSHQKIIEQALLLLRKQKENKDSYFFDSERFSKIKIDKNNFQHIPPRLPEKKMLFVDGGESCIFSSPSFSFYMMRVYKTIYDGKEKSHAARHDFFLYIESALKNDLLQYVAHVISPHFANLSTTFASDDPELKLNFGKINHAEIASILRRQAELQWAVLSAAEADSIVIDGSLHCKSTYEESALEALYAKAAVHNALVCGLSKSSDILTDTGNAAALALERYGTEGAWLYYPALHSDTAYSTGFVKLHPLSYYIFRFDIQKKSEEQILAMAAALASHSTDPAFIGYPYGLLEADQHARISKEEKRRWQVFFQAKLGSSWQEIEKALHSSDAHAVLDSMHY